MKTLTHSIEIDAAPITVWSLLIDGERLSEWNPFLRSLEGELVVGGRLRVRVQPPGGRGMTFRPVVLDAVPGRRLRWLGRLVAPGLFDGEHDFHLEDTRGGGTRLTQSERFSGLLVPLLGKMLRRTEEGFAAMDLALKERAERSQTLSEA